MAELGKTAGSRRESIIAFHNPPIAGRNQGGPGTFSMMSSVFIAERIKIIAMNPLTTPRPITAGNSHKEAKDCSEIPKAGKSPK